MNAQCTHCNTIFRVDPSKVPAGGVRARCSICRNVFEIRADDAAVPVAVAAAAVAAAVPEPPRAAEPIAVPPAPAAAPVAPTPAAPAPAAPAAPAPAPAAPAPAPAAAPAGRPNPFGSADPSAKARRLARALVSDIVTYHPERRDQSLQNGTLKREFMEEIKKSWEEYVGQVGAEMARSTPHFRDALNDILAKGQPLF
jgi:predicted Zn finger-like uncharacterized protein